MTTKKVNYIMESQQLLKDGGFYDGKIDGKWGVKSHEALQKALSENDEKVAAQEAIEVVEPPEPKVHKVIVKRFKETSRSTLSTFKCTWCDVTGYFLEPSGPSTTLSGMNRRIPTGIYNLVKHSGNKYKNVVRLFNENVPKERAILIHQGNTPSNTVGCLLAGTTFGLDKVNTSTPKLRELMDAIYKVGVENVKVEIIDDF